MWDPFEIDPFSSRLNFKIPTYVSWKPDPDAKYVNALFMQILFLCFSTFQPYSNLSAENRAGPILVMRMRLAISCYPLVQFDDSIEFQSNINLQVSLA